ncbi:MAG: hypothetical protein WDZ48_03290, partial [Pirellulales bacterium]
MVHDVIGRTLKSGCFFVAAGATLRIEHVPEETVGWETFRGHLVDAAHARTTQRFAAWHVFLDSGNAPAEAPILSIRSGREPSRIFVTRQILSHAFEAYEDSPGVILSRPVQKWISELVGAIEPESIQRGTARDELGTLLFQAVVGTSRLPITS